MLRRDLDGLIQSGALEQVESGNPFLRFREGAVRDEEAIAAHPDRLRGGKTGQTVADDSPTTIVVGGDPFLDVVQGRIEGLAGGIGADEHDVAHGNSFPGGRRLLVERSQAESTAEPTQGLGELVEGKAGAPPRGSRAMKKGGGR